MGSVCPSCGASLTASLAGKGICALIATALGAKATRHPLGVLICAIGGLIVGHYIDRQIAKHCPACGAVLRLASIAVR